MKTAIYPGTFDPITHGHIDVIKKSLNIFDRVIVATTDNINKNYHFSIGDRLNIINNSLFKDLRLNKNKIKVKQAQYRADNKDKIRMREADHRQKNKKTIALRKKTKVHCPHCEKLISNRNVSRHIHKHCKKAPI